MSNEKFKWNTARLLLAFTVDVADDKQPPVARQFWFPVLERVIRAFAAKVDESKTDLFQRAGSDRPTQTI